MPGVCDPLNGNVFSGVEIRALEMTKGRDRMTFFASTLHARLRNWLRVLAVSIFVVAGSLAAASRIDEGQLLTLGFKVLVAATPVQEAWVKRLPPGELRPMQRNGKKYFIYPDASRNQVYVGGPQEYDAYVQLHPDSRKDPQDAANKSSAYRKKQDETMRKATARDLSDPFLGVTWADLGW